MDDQSTPDIRHDWTQAQAQALFDLPLTELLFRAQGMHRRHQPHDAVQLSTLLSIKTGSCPEDCGYCSQSARNKTGLESEALLSVDTVLEKARQAKELGASRFCMGAAWRSPKKDSRQFDQVLEMVRGVRALGMEACVTAGMLDREQADQLKQAGLTAYNHNIDTSREHYDKVITTRTFDDRLETIKHVADAGIHVCSGGILGLGEGETDRVSMLVTLATLTPHPESVPINALVAIKGTPLEDQPPVDPLDIVRVCAVARIMMPGAMVRLSAGRGEMGREAQMLAFMAGANSIFYGDQLLTTGNPAHEEDLALLKKAGMRALVPADREAGRAAATTEALPATSGAPAAGCGHAHPGSCGAQPTA